MTHAYGLRILVISLRTAENHVEHILTKLGFSSRTRIAVWVSERAAARETGSSDGHR